MKILEVYWTQAAELDLEAIVKYIQVDDEKRAKKIFFAIKKECEGLYFFPKRKRIVPELQQIGILKYREIIFKRWRIVYKIENEKIYILLVADSSQNLEDLLLQRLLR